MRRGPVITLTLAVAAGCVIAQGPKEAEGARELYYTVVPKKEKLPPFRKASYLGGTTRTSATSQATGVDAVPPPAVHFGFRYNVVLVDPNSGKSQTVDSNRVFRKGDCVAIDFETNWSAYLYVLAKQSSGDWQPLIPSRGMSDESNILNPGEKIRAPKQYCFELGDPPGTETLFVVVSHDPKDVYDLNEGIKGHAAPRMPAAPREPAVDAPEEPAPSSAPALMQLADARLVNRQVAEMREQFQTRDIAIRRINQPLTAQEPAYSVYVVNVSGRPSYSVVAQIELRHR